MFFVSILNDSNNVKFYYYMIEVDHYMCLLIIRYVFYVFLVIVHELFIVLLIFVLILYIIILFLYSKI